MSPITKENRIMEISFPRVSGDEPVVRPEGDPQGMFSPRERG